MDLEAAREVRTGLPHFSDQYDALLRHLLSQPVETNGRTGKGVFVGLPCQLQVDLQENPVPICGHRKLYPHQAAAEMAWFMGGTRNVNNLRELGCRFWDKFVDNDGHTVSNAYGYRWRRHFTRDQLDRAIGALTWDLSDRQVYVSAWDPSSDGLGNRTRYDHRAGEHVPVRNIPCPLGFHLSVTGGRLNMVVPMRSSDVVVGLPYDVMGHAILLHVLCTTLISVGALPSAGLSPGTLTFSLFHPHVYQVHEEIANEMLARYRGPIDGPAAICWTLAHAVGEAKGFVRGYKELSAAVQWPAYEARPELVA